MVVHRRNATTLRRIAVHQNDPGLDETLETQPVTYDKGIYQQLSWLALPAPPILLTLAAHPAKKMLRPLTAIGLGLSFVSSYLFDSHYVAVWGGQDGYVSCSSHPIWLVWSLLGILLFCHLMRQDQRVAPAGVPGLGRRFAAMWIDLCFSILVLGGILALGMLLVEGARTRAFAWHFSRHYMVLTDYAIGYPAVLLTFVLIFLYFAYPLTRGKQTVGRYLLRLQVVATDREDSRFPLRRAISRAWNEFTGWLSPFVWLAGRDHEGRTSYDIETNCKVVLVKDLV